MDIQNQISKVRDGLKLSNEVEDARKMEGLEMLATVLSKRDPQLDKYGYIEVIFKELLKLLKFESGYVLKKITDLLSEYYFKSEKYQDDLMESLILRYGLANDSDTRLECLRRITSLIDCMDDNIAKHSKKLIELSDLPSTVPMKTIVIEILEKLKTKLPSREDIRCQLQYYRTTHNHKN